MSAQSDLHKIVEDGLCLGCGLCAAMAPDAIIMERGEDGDLRPVANEGFSPDQMAMVEQICPSLRIEGVPETEAALAPHHDIVWGPYHEMSLGHAAKADIRHEASTAGLLTALAIYLLDEKLVDGILHAKAAPADGSFGPANFGMATISRNADEVRAASGSRYGPTAALTPVKDLLESEETFAVIAKPCDLNALRNLAHLDERVNERFAYWLTMLCGGFQPDEAFRGFLSDNDLSEQGLTHVRYRGYGCPGPTSLQYDDGQRHEFHYLDFWGEDESQWSMPLRCKICPDGIGEAADIVAGDAWSGASPDRHESLTDAGINSVITRTAKGEALYQQAVSAGIITKTEVVDCAFLSDVQPHQVAKKLAGQARCEGLRAAGAVAPLLVNMRAEALSDALGSDDYEAQKQGAFQRAKAAKNKS